MQKYERRGKLCQVLALPEGWIGLVIDQVTQAGRERLLTETRGLEHTENCLAAG